MSISKGGISPEDFYGGRNSRQERIEAIIKKSNNSHSRPQPKFMTRLLGPSKTWKIFKKQQDAIDCCLQRRNGLMPFAFEDVNGRRMFLAAHPKVFWALNSDRFFKNCSSYEIIREHSACKLYLDIEFELAFNRNSNGDKMLDNVLDIINFNLNENFNIACTRNEILDLNSSSDTKFSHHVIYEIDKMAFQDNYAVGSFVKIIASELRSAFESSLTEDNTKLQKIAEKYNLKPSDIVELFISDRKGEKKLFIDEGVYTKNRHFRLLGSSKKGKNVSLTVSDSNKYKPVRECSQLDYFLDSLLTYFSWEVERVLECGGEQGPPHKPHRMQKQATGKIDSGFKQVSSVHHQIDSFIESLISPNGVIRRKVFFSDSSTIVYDIQGYRFCQKINREHKSNNIKFVVDLESLVFYQKCYDPDCADFRSDLKHLPDEICFLFEDDNFFPNGLEEILDEDFGKVLEENQNGFDLSLSDEDLEKVANCAETLMDVNW